MSLRVLGIDVTGPGGGAALLLPDGMRRETIPPAVRRGRDLVPIIERMLREAELRPADLDLVACGVGPGSFTGIRIGVATAATIAYAAGVPALDVGSLHGVAGNAPAGAARVLVVLDARRGRLFAARFARDGGGLRLEGEYFTAPPADLARDLDASTWVLGDGRASFPDLFQRFPGDADAPVRPDVIARIAAERFAAGERKTPAQIRPLYLRLSDPEIRRQEP